MLGACPANILVLPPRKVVPGAYCFVAIHYHHRVWRMSNRAKGRMRWKRVRARR
jgi:hypothetical protein